jgi:hypothetical protein
MVHWKSLGGQLSVISEMLFIISFVRDHARLIKFLTHQIFTSAPPETGSSAADSHRGFSTTVMGQIHQTKKNMTYLLTPLPTHTHFVDQS